MQSAGKRNKNIIWEKHRGAGWIWDVRVSVKVNVKLINKTDNVKNVLVNSNESWVLWDTKCVRGELLPKRIVLKMHYGEKISCVEKKQKMIVYSTSSSSQKIIYIYFVVKL